MPKRHMESGSGSGRRVRPAGLGVRAPGAFAFACALLLMLLALVGCTATVTVSDVAADPGSYYGKTVRVVGIVTGGVDVAGFTVYRIADRGDELWVVSYRSDVPADGESIAVTGRINKAVNLSGVPLPTHLVEDSREAAE